MPSRAIDFVERLISLGSRFKFLGVLRSIGTRRPNGRAFVDWQTYYRAWLGADSAATLIKHSVPWVGDDVRHTELINGLAAGHRAVVVWAPPGCGKSRFALELARRLETGREEALLVQHDLEAVRAELPELAQSKRVVLIVDDAQSCPDIVALLGHAAAQSADAQISLVCLARSTARSDVTGALAKLLPPGAVQELDLGRPGPKLVRSLIDQLLPKTSPMHRDTIDRFVRQSWFGAVFVSTLVSRERKLPQSFQRQYLRDQFCRQPLIEPARDVCPIETALRALAVYAALTPFAKQDESIRALAAQLSGLPVDRVELLVNRMLAAGLFQEDAQARVRPVPDVLGDLILEEACLDIQGKPTAYSNQLLERVFELDAQTAGTNCGEIGQLFAAANDVDLLSRVILERARTVARDNRDAIMQLLQLCQPLAVSRAPTVVEVVTGLNSRGILRAVNDSVELTALGLLLNAAQAEPTAVPAAMKLGKDLYIHVLEDEQSRRLVREQLDAGCGFALGRSVSYCKAVAQNLQAWVGDPNAQVAAISTALSGRFLRLDVEGSAEVLQPTPDSFAVRDIAVETLVRGIKHTDARIQGAAVAALEHYAVHDPGADKTVLAKWLTQVTQEVGQLSTAMVELVKESTSLPVRACVELQGWLWWARGLEVLHKAGTTALGAVSDSEAYQLWKSLYATRLPLRAIIPTDVPDMDARRQHVANFATTDETQLLFNALDLKHSESGAWRTLWLSVLEQTPAGRMDARAAGTVAEFARRHQSDAWSFVTEPDAKGVLFAIVPLLLVELRKLDSTRASRVAQDVVPGSKLEAAWLQVLWSVSELNEGESTILARGLDSTETVYRTAGALLSATGIDRVAAFRRVFASVTRHPTDEELWAIVIEHFVSWTEGLLPQSEATMTPTESMSQVAEGLISLLQNLGGQIRWGYQRHTRQLAPLFAILARVQPQRLEQWMRQAFGQPGGSTGQWEDASPISMRRLRDSMSLLRGAPEAASAVELLKRWTTKS